MSFSYPQTTLEVLGNFLFPKACFGCSKKGRYLCQKCLYEFHDPDVFYPKNADFALISFSYRTTVIKKALRKLKYSSASDISGELAEIISADLAPYLKYGGEPVVCEIPMTIARKRKRGFNQAEILAKHLANALNLEHKTLLIKTRETKPQAEIKNRSARFENIKNSFALCENLSAPKKNSKTAALGQKSPSFVIIVDDIITTSATMNEAARVLKKSGATKIICVAVAG